MNVPDTSVLLPLFDRAHPNHERAHREVSGNLEFAVLASTLTETATVLWRMLRGQPQRAQALRTHLSELSSMPGVRLLPDPDPAAGLALFLAHPRLSMPDAQAIAGAVSLKARLVTFDDRQHQAWVDVLASQEKRARPKNRP